MSNDRALSVAAAKTVADFVVSVLKKVDPDATPTVQKPILQRVGRSQLVKLIVSTDTLLVDRELKAFAANFRSRGFRRRNSSGTHLRLDKTVDFGEVSKMVSVTFTVPDADTEITVWIPFR